MKLSRAGFILLVAIAVASTSGCSVVNRIRSKNELNEAAKSYKSGRFPDAEQHARRALELDPNSKIAPAFIARSIHAQYRPGVETAENNKVAQNAIDAYKQILANDPNNDEAYKAVVALLLALKKEDEQRQWILKKANDAQAPAVQRSEAYTILSSQDWQCSFQTTEQPSIKKTSPGGKVEYVKGDQKDYDKAQQCATRGMEEVEKAISFDGSSETAWSYKTNLLREKAKLAEMDGNAEQKAAFDKQADAAQARTKELNKQAEAKRAADEAAKAAESPAK
jgi:hypothetical protein